MLDRGGAEIWIIKGPYSSGSKRTISILFDYIASI
jgi:hypothetical protein